MYFSTILWFLLLRNNNILKTWISWNCRQISSTKHGLFIFIPVCSCYVVFFLAREWNVAYCRSVSMFQTVFQLYLISNLIIQSNTIKLVKKVMKFISPAINITMAYTLDWFRVGWTVSVKPAKTGPLTDQVHKKLV